MKTKTLRAKRKVAWIRVTTEYVCTFATKDCPNCNGEGHAGDAEHGFTVCSCAVFNFRKEIERLSKIGNYRQRQQLMNGRLVSWQEYRPSPVGDADNITELKPNDNQRSESDSHSD